MGSRCIICIYMIAIMYVQTKQTVCVLFQIFDSVELKDDTFVQSSLTCKIYFFALELFSNFRRQLDGWFMYTYIHILHSRCTTRRRNVFFSSFVQSYLVIAVYFSIVNIYLPARQAATIHSTIVCSMHQIVQSQCTNICTPSRLGFSLFTFFDDVLLFTPALHVQ